MADPVIRIKRSSVEGKIPTPDQVPLGEVALNTFDGKFYASKNVGIGTTVFAINPWTVGTGTNTYNTYFTAGNVGIASTLPSAILDVVGDAKFTGIVTAIDGRLISGIGINTASGNVGYGVTTLDFRGSGISTITISSGVATINLISSAGAATTQTPGRTVTSYTTTAGISTYDVTYEVGYLDVFLNGVRLDSTEYTATTGTNIILSQGPSDGDSLDLIYYTLGIGDTGPQGANGADGTSYWVQTDVGIHTLSSVGIGTTDPTSKLTVVGDVNIIGIITAISFVGNLTGTATSTTNIPNLSGDVSSNNTVTTLATVNGNVGTYGDAGSIPSITVNAKGLVTGVTTVAPNNGQLSLGVSGTGLSGSATFTANQSGSSTFTVTSNATDANTPSTIVARDASGNFSAGTITANLTGTATTATNLANAANITTGTIDSARLTGTYNIDISGNATTATYATSAGIATYASNSGIASYSDVSGIATVAQGLTGNPTITITDLTALGNVSIAGTLTYEDVTSVDSLGIITARSGINIGSVASIGATISPTGNGIFSGIITATSFVKSGGTSSEFLKADGSIDSSVYLTSESDTLDTVTGRGNTTTNGIQVGIITATSFVKSGGTSSEFLKADGTSDSNTYITGVGIQSGGTIVGYGITTLNFVGTGNTFAINGTTVDISISGSGGGGGGGESYWTQTDVGIHTLGSVGIGTTDPTSKLTVSGDVLVVGIITATDFNSSSDITLKNNIFPIKNPIDKIIKINGVNFEWKENNKKSAGVIAQEIEKIMPELVSDAEIKSVNYNGLIGLLVEVVKEQQKQIDEINSLLKTLQINT